ncbi:MAG: hypothetical protein Q9221_004065 [Calogaya cf. arnoldii]
MKSLFLSLALVGIAVAAPILDVAARRSTTSMSPTTTSSALPTGVYTHTGTSISAIGTSIVVPSASAFPVLPPPVSVPSASFSPPAVLPRQSVPGATSGVLDGSPEGGWCTGKFDCFMNHAHASSGSPSGVPAENACVGSPHCHHPASGSPPAPADGNYHIGVPEVLLAASSSGVDSDTLIGALASRAPPTPPSQFSGRPPVYGPQGTPFGYGTPTRPRDPPSRAMSAKLAHGGVSADGNYGIGVPHSPPATLAEKSHVDAPSHGIDAENACVGCPEGVRAGAGVEGGA